MEGRGKIVSCWTRGLRVVHTLQMAQKQHSRDGLTPSENTVCASESNDRK